MAIAQWCCFAKSLRYSVAQRCSGVRQCFVLSGSNPASAALSVWQFLRVSVKILQPERTRITLCDQDL